MAVTLSSAPVEELATASSTDSRTGAQPAHRSLLRRLYAAIMEGQRRKAAREVAARLRHHRTNEEFRRELERRLGSP